MDTKTCSRCKTEKEATTDNFTNEKSSADGLSRNCKQCKRELDKEYRSTRKEYFKVYGKKNRETLNANWRRWNQKQKNSTEK